MTKSTLRQRIRYLEDVESIKTLTARYADAVNKGWNGKSLDLDAIPELFTADACFTDHQLYTTVGAAAIAAELPSATAMVDFSMHAFLNPSITVDGETATGSWLLWIASVIDHRPGAAYLSADLGYLRTATGWRIRSVKVYDGIRISGSPTEDS
jgi:hypothetical protein